MENRGLLFIPDISGFTRFVQAAEIDHSRLIIQQLLEALINANELGLEVSEIEGDAILFYKFGEPPPMETLYRQVAAMFSAFHRHLIAYDQHKYCQCMACRQAIDLTLKFVTHYGEFTGYQVKTFRKLIGRDVIVAHQLLKNDIDQHEYWLVTPGLSLADPPLDSPGWLSWESSRKPTETGEIPFRYARLGPLRQNLGAEPWPPPPMEGMQQVASHSARYPTDLIRLFHLTGDFRNRPSWWQGLRRVEELSDPELPRVGMSCRAILAGGAVTYRSTSYRFDDNSLEFTESTEEKKEIRRFQLREEDGGTRLTIDLYRKKTLAGMLEKALGLPDRSLARSMQRLEALAAGGQA